MSLRWDIFCRVIDNFGDIGVCWRLAADLAQRGHSVRLWVDDASALSWMAPLGVSGVQVAAWTQALDMTTVQPGDVMVEAFGCDINPEFIAAYASAISARGQKSLWINLEYLTAESFALRCHGLPSPVMSGPGQGLTKHFFYPGFAPGTGGLLRELNLPARQATFDRADWLAHHHIPLQGERLISLFCYEPAGLNRWLEVLAQDAQPTLLLVTPGRAARAVQNAVLSKNALQPNWNERKQLSFFYLPTLTQEDFDHLLWACDLNMVRGEDSLVRALWAGKPLVWQIYPQDDNAHHAKLLAFLDWLQAPAFLRALHLVWNGLADTVSSETDAAFALSTHWSAWQKTYLQARQILLTQDDLTSQLLGFAAKRL